MPNLKITGFADEISPAGEEQIQTLAELNIRHLELRGVDKTNVLDLSDDQIKAFRQALGDAGIGVSSIGSPIGKVPVDSDLVAHWDRFQIALERAEQFSAPFIRVFSFYLKETPVAEARPIVIEQLARMAEAAGQAGVTLVHENEKGIYGDNADRCEDIFKSVNNSHLRCAFDFANFVQCDETVASNAWPKLAEYTVYFHIKDATRDPKGVVPAGHGDGDVKDVLGEAIGNGFEGFLSLEPHLGEKYGSTGAERFTASANALREVLSELGAEAE